MMSIFDKGNNMQTFRIKPLDWSTYGIPSNPDSATAHPLPLVEVHVDLRSVRRVNITIDDYVVFRKYVPIDIENPVDECERLKRIAEYEWKELLQTALISADCEVNL